MTHDAKTHEQASSSDNDEAGKQMEHDILSACIGKELHTVELPADKKDAGEMTQEEIINTLKNKVKSVYQIMI